MANAAATAPPPDEITQFATVQVGQDPTQLFVAGTGHIWTAPKDTAMPATPPPTTPWVDNGLTTEDGVTLTFGRTTDSIKAWQAFDPVRTIVTEALKTAKFTLQQMTATNIILALGGGTVAATPPSIYTPPDPTVVQMNALYLTASDGSNQWVFYCPRGMISDNVEIMWKKSGEALLPLVFQVQATPAGTPPYQMIFPASFGTS
jgi:hypothetical protein